MKRTKLFKGMLITILVMSISSCHKNDNYGVYSDSIKENYHQYLEVSKVLKQLDNEMLDNYFYDKSNTLEGFKILINEQLIKSNKDDLSYYEKLYYLNEILNDNYSISDEKILCTIASNEINLQFNNLGQLDGQVLTVYNSLTKENVATYNSGFREIVHFPRFSNNFDHSYGDYYLKSANGGNVYGPFSLSISNLESKVTYEEKTIVNNQQAFLDTYMKYEDKLFTIAPKVNFLDGYDYSEYDIKAFMMDSIAYPEKNLDKTTVFGYLGIPEKAKRNELCPAVIIIHGGSADGPYYQMVEEWVKRGYVAVTYSTSGYILDSSWPNTIESGLKRFRNPTGGPENLWFHNEGIKDYHNSFFYHASANAILLNTYLRSLSYVDSNKIGITGASWGGFLTCLSLGYDNRFAFAIPVYGALGIEEGHGEINLQAQNYPHMSKYYNIDPLVNETTPILMINNNYDHYFSLEGTRKLANMTKSTTCLYKDSFPHDNYDYMMTLEMYEFAEGVINHRHRLARVIKEPTMQDPFIKVQNDNNKEIVKAKLHYLTVGFDTLYATSVVGDYHSDYWNSIDFEVNDSSNIKVPLMNNITAFYVELIDNDGFSITTNLVTK